MISPDSDHSSPDLAAVLLSSLRSGEMLFSNPPEKLMAVSLDRSGRGERWGPPLEIHEAPPPGTPLSSFGWARYSDLALAVS